MNYIGLDVASITGVAIVNPRVDYALVGELKGDPISQLNGLLKIELIGDRCFVMEKMHYFRNAVTIRSLIERYGFLKYSLMDLGYTVHEVAPKMARKFLGTKTKVDTFDMFLPYFLGGKLTNNHTDALAVALYQGHVDGFNLKYSDIAVLEWGKHDNRGSIPSSENNTQL